jgi:hypothetical protein
MFHKIDYIDNINKNICKFNDICVKYYINKNDIIIKKKLAQIWNPLITKNKDNLQPHNPKNYDMYINYMRELKKNKSPNKFDNYNHIH